MATLAGVAPALRAAPAVRVDRRLRGARGTRGVLGGHDLVEHARRLAEVAGEHHGGRALCGVLVHHVDPLRELEQAVGLALVHLGALDGVDGLLDAAGNGDALVRDALALRRHGLRLCLRRDDRLRAGGLGVVLGGLEVVLGRDDVVHGLLDLAGELDPGDERGHEHVAVVAHLRGDDLVDRVCDGVLLAEDLVEGARGNLRAQGVREVVLHLADRVLQGVEALVHAGLLTGVHVVRVDVVLDGDVELDRDVVAGLGVKRHVLVLGHEADVVRDVDERHLDVKAGTRESVEAPQALDDGHVLLPHDVPRGEHDGHDDNHQNDGANETHVGSFHSCRRPPPTGK